MRLGSRLVRSVLGVSLFGALAVSPLLGGCSAETGEPDDGGGQVSEEELRSEEESFTPLEATDAELTRAKEPERTFDHELTLFAIPAPKLVSLSWKSPGGLARRTLINEGFGFSRAIGHVFVRVDCGAIAGKPATSRQVGQTSTGDEFRTMVLKEKAGLGVLFRTVPGALETEVELDATLKDRYASGRIGTIRYGISGEACHALLDYVKEYDKRDVEDEYGFVRPLYQEGSGCSAFGMSFLRLAGLMEPYMGQEWKFDVRIPMTLIGGTTNPGNEVSVARLFTLGRGWASPTEPHLRLNGWDPTLMYKSIELRAKQGLKDGSVKVEKRGRALGLVVDKRTATPSPRLTSREFFSGPPAPNDAKRFLTADE